MSSYVYKTMVLPFFDYCDMVYAQATSQCLDKLQRLQNTGIRLCLSLPPRSNVSLIHRTAKIPYLKNRRELHAITHMHSRRSCPDLVDNRDIRTRAHDGLLFKLPKPRLETTKRSAYYAGAKCWISLPVSLGKLKTHTI